MLYESEKSLAISAVTAAAQLCQRVRQQKELFTQTKSDQSPVTIADLGSQAIVCRFLAQAFPDNPVIAEEEALLLQQPANAALLGQVTRYVQDIVPDATPEKIITWINRGNGKIASRYWTLDPIDGTKGFIRGDQYAIALALVEEGEVKIGVLACPALPLQLDQAKETGSLFLAVKGEGTMIMPLSRNNAQLLQVNQYQDPEQILAIESVESAHSDRHQQQAVAQALSLSQNPLQMDSQAKYGVVARGEADLYLRIPLPQHSAHRENIWDHAAGFLVVSEAGGRVSDLDGKPLDFSVGSKLQDNRGIVASNGAIHEQVLKALRKAR